MTDFVQQTLKSARDSFRSGDLERAESLFRAILARDPVQPDSLYGLGRVALQTGRDDEAVPLFRKALERHPTVAQLHVDLAVALQNLGWNEEAAAEAREALGLQPSSLSAMNTLGNALRALGQATAAVECFKQAVTMEPGRALLHLNLASALKDSGDLAGAAASLARALEIDPRQPGAWCRLGDVLRGTRRFGEARDALEAALALKPELVEARVLLAQSLLDLGEPAAALDSFAHARALRPGDPEILCGLGNALRASGKPEEAAVAFRDALAARPDFAEGWCNLSTVALDRGRTGEAIEHARRAIAVDPDLPEAHWNLAQALLTEGDLTEGWRKYEYRLWKRDAAELAFPFPLWEGAPLAGRTLFVTAEQGVGDEILFASCVPDVLRSGARCVLECDARLVPLFARSFPGARWIARLKDAAAYPADLPRPDFRIAIGSLPLHFRPDVESFPRVPSYLVPDAAQVEKWRRRYAALGPGLKVGISWRGGKEALVRRARSIPLPEWAGLAAVPGVRLVDLQYGDTREERRGTPAVALHDWEDADPLLDLDSFAAQIAALDLVISVDNSTVHLAGAVGTPAWVLLPSTADWRWMKDREDTPWYPSLRLFRQREPGEWGEALEKVRRELADHVAGAAGHESTGLGGREPERPPRGARDR